MLGSTIQLCLDMCIAEARRLGGLSMVLAQILLLNDIRLPLIGEGCRPQAPMSPIPI